MGANDLTTLTAVKSWLKVQNATDDALLSGLVSACSIAFLQQIVRDTIFKRSVTRTLQGVAGNYVMLPTAPVISVSSLMIAGVAIPAATTFGTAGYLLEPFDGLPPANLQRLTLNGFGFSRAPGGVVISYVDGYFIPDEPATIAAGAVTVSALAGVWGRDEGVKTAAGVTMTRVSGTPGVGQYQVDVATAGKYNFNSADNGTAVLVSYSYIPADIWQGVTEWCAERYRYRDRIGQTSHTLQGQQTTAFDNSGVPKFVAAIIGRYQAKVPVG